MQHKVNKRGKSKSSSQGCTGLQKRPEIDVPSFVEIPTSMQNLLWKVIVRRVKYVYKTCRDLFWGQESLL